MRAALTLLLFAASAAAAAPAPDPAVLAPDPVQKAARPAADPPGGPFSGSLDVSLSDPTPGAVLLYTLDGSDPDTVDGAATHVYQGPLRLDTTTVLKARAVKPGWAASEILIESYETGTAALAPKGAARRRTDAARIRRYRRGQDEFDVDGTRLIEDGVSQEGAVRPRAGR